MNILLTAVNGPSGICFAKSLSEINNVHLVGTSGEDGIIGKLLVDSFHIVPVASNSNYLKTLQEIITKEHIDYVVPLVDEEVNLLSRFAPELGCRVLVSPYRTISYTSNKRKMYDIAADYLPKLFDREDRDFPMFAKPEVGRGGKGARIVKNRAELQLVPTTGYVLQEILQGPEVTVDTIFDFDGNLVVAVPRIRSLVEQGISISGLVFHDEVLLRIVKDLSRRVKFVGPINFQFMRRGEEYRLTEVNARGSGGMGITIHSGVDIPKLAYELIDTGMIRSNPQMKEGLYPNFEEILERQRVRRRLLEREI